MTQVRVESFSVSIDGYGAGPNRDRTIPSEWAAKTCTSGLFRRERSSGPTARAMAQPGSTTTSPRGDSRISAHGYSGEHVRTDSRSLAGSELDGVVGKNPPYHVPVFVLTHHPRPSVRMEGNTTFHFVTEGIQEALDRAREAADGMDVRIGGGASTLQQYLRADLIDELHIAISPVLLGRGSGCSRGWT